MINNVKKHRLILVSLIIINFIMRVNLILQYKNNINLGSDDLNYIKSAIVLLEKGVFTFHNYNELTVFVMPLYPLFLAVCFKFFGYGLAGLQAVRVIQIIFSCLTILFIYLISKQVLDYRFSIFSAVLFSFYPPSITTPGYFLTESIFTTLLTCLIFFSIKFIIRPKLSKIIIISLVWSIGTMIRPTIALYPLLLFIALLIYNKFKWENLLTMSYFKYGVVMGIIFITVFSPWWVRNYYEYGKFIPLAASSGNPMLQGTYIDYKQTAENTVLYSLGENAFETNEIEVKIAKQRIIEGFRNDFNEYFRWYTVGKTFYFWYGAFYWKEFMGIKTSLAIWYHRLILLGFFGMLIAIFMKRREYYLLIIVVGYFNFIHCIYMTFDRYAFPLMPVLCIFCSYFILSMNKFIRGTYL